MGSFLGRLLRDESGATAIEYGLLAALIAVVLISSITVMGTSISTTFNIIASDLNSVSGS